MACIVSVHSHIVDSTPDSNVLMICYHCSSMARLAIMVGVAAAGAVGVPGAAAAYASQQIAGSQQSTSHTVDTHVRSECRPPIRLEKAEKRRINH